MATNLYFDLAGVLRLAEHAVAATEHGLSFTEHLDGATGAAALQWVADWGTYLMSNGQPALLQDPADPSSNIVVYADGYGPGSDRRALGATEVGQDDFVEHLPLTGDTGTALLGLLRQGAARGYRWFVLTVDRDAVGFAVRRDRVTGGQPHE